MSRGTTRRRAFGRRTRTVPNSSRSVTKTRPSGPPTNPPLRLRSMSAIAPGGGGSSMRSTTPTGWPASSRISASRGAWSDASTIRPPSSRQPSTASARRVARPSGSTGSRHPNASPMLRPPDAIATPRRLGLPGQLEGPRRRRAGLPVARPEVRRGPGLGQLAGLDELGSPLVGLAPQEVRGLGDLAGLVEDEQRARVDVVEAGRRAQARRPRPPPRRRRPSPATRPPRPAATDRRAAPSNRARSAARRSRRRAPPGRGARGSRPRPPVGSRNSDAGSSTTRSTVPIVRWSVGSNARSESISSPKNSIRIGSSSTAGTRRRCRRAARTRHARQPR